MDLGPDSALRRKFDSVIHGTDTNLYNLLDMHPSGGDSHDGTLLRDVPQYSTGRLIKEIANLKTELEILHRNTESNVFVTDRNMIEPSMDSINLVFKNEVSKINMRLGEIFEARPAFQSDSFRHEKGLLKNLLSNYSRLIDLLEIPQLMESCVRDEQYTDALSLFDLVQSNVRGKLENVPIIQMIASQMHSIKSDLVTCVVDSLSMKPLGLREIQNLLMVYRLLFPSITGMRDHFLVLRINFFNQMKSKLISKSPKFVREYSELVRVHFVGIVSQCRVLFPSEISASPLGRFVHSELDDYLASLDMHLSNLDMHVFADTFMIVSDMCRALSEIGMCVDSIIVEKFELAMKHTLETAICELERSFKAELAGYDGKVFTSLVSATESMNATIQLTKHRPNAVLFNDLVGVLNQTRLLPLSCLKDWLCQRVDSVLFSALQLILSSTSLTDKDAMIWNFCQILVPTIESYMSQIFSEEVSFSKCKNHPEYRKLRTSMQREASLQSDDPQEVINNLPVDDS